MFKDYESNKENFDSNIDHSTSSITFKSTKMGNIIIPTESSNASIQSNPKKINNFTNRIFKEIKTKKSVKKQRNLKLRGHRAPLKYDLNVQDNNDEKKHNNIEEGERLTFETFSNSFKVSSKHQEAQGESFKTNTTNTNTNTTTALNDIQKIEEILKSKK